jgi:hypothetical protein
MIEFLINTVIPIFFITLMIVGILVIILFGIKIIINLFNYRF